MVTGCLKVELRLEACVGDESRALRSVVSTSAKQIRADHSTHIDTLMRQVCGRGVVSDLSDCMVPQWSQRVDCVESKMSERFSREVVELSDKVSDDVARVVEEERKKRTKLTAAMTDRIDDQEVYSQRHPTRALGRRLGC